MSDDDDNDKIMGSETKGISKTINKPSNTYNRLFNKTTTVSSIFFNHEMVNPTEDHVICS